MRVLRTRVRIHPLMLLMIPLSCRLGLQAEAVAAACALCIHESAHLAAAKAVHVAIPELRLMPFGGSASIGNPYALSPCQLGFTAAAGPLSNLASVFVVAALAHWGVVSPAAILPFIRISLLLMVFNLMPALPLDGGRMLYAILFRRIGAAKSLSIGIWAGRALAAALLVGTIVLFIKRGVINLSYIFAAIFLIASGPQERSALSVSNVHTLISALSPVSGASPVSLAALDSSCSAGEALRASNPGAVNLYAVYKDGVLAGFSDDRSLIDLCMDESASAPVSSARLYSLHETQKGPTAVSQ